ncbi:MAG: hypothetical protein HKN72_10660 [Gemmatimonadetes bacterium]|nr:hypothetical protein [Gemmatimonadota bacterium]NNF13679.1 hypothetical protein [Gemmatimonadota bacterium]NNL30774.1 hypothetical protein [Gemmatimonadota bacterium]
MLEILGGLVVATAVSGVLPIVNAELLVVTAAAALPAVGVPLVAIASTVGQMSTKFSLFAVARWAPSRLPVKARRALDRAARPLEQRDGAVSSLVFASAATGIPPFYGVSLAAGALGVKPVSFLATGSLGRLARFAVLAWLGQRVGSEALEMFAGVIPAVVGG